MDIIHLIAANPGFSAFLTLWTTILIADRRQKKLA